jgi:hydroxyethylthiazole kinase-like uncharacterized protein yjeF
MSFPTDDGDDDDDDKDAVFVPPLPSRVGSAEKRKMREAVRLEVKRNKIQKSMPKFLDAQTASDIDVALMDREKHGWSIDQLMELAGLSVADVIHDEKTFESFSAIILCGPGNNGGDGLVAAKHLAQRTWEIDVWHPKLTDKAIQSRKNGSEGGKPWKNEELFMGLYYSCKAAGVRFLQEDQLDLVGTKATMNFERPNLLDYELIVDAMFGFSFQGAPREPYKQLLKAVTKTQEIVSKMSRDGPEAFVFPKVLSIDIPSGDDVNEGPTKYSIHPDFLVSLTAPKLCVLRRAESKLCKYPCRHFLGGRFISRKLVDEFAERVDLEHWNYILLEHEGETFKQYADLGFIHDVDAFVQIGP